MTRKYEVRVQQKHVDFYHVEADSPESAQQQVLTGVCSGILGNVSLENSIKFTPIFDYAMELEPIEQQLAAEKASESLIKQWWK